MPKVEQMERLEKMNQFIRFMADLDRSIKPGPYSSFFFSKKSYKGTPNNYARFEFINNRLMFIDHYTEEKVYPYPSTKSKASGFSSGGTLWGLVNDFRKWIITGKESDGENGYGGLYCTHWGPRWSFELKDQLIQKAKEIGYLSKEVFSFSAYCKRLAEKGFSLPEVYREESEKQVG